MPSSRTRCLPLAALTTALVVFCALFVAAAPAAAVVLSPDRTADAATGLCTPGCSLREAVIDANRRPGADVILLGPGTWRLTIPGRGESGATSGDLDVTGDLAVIGAGADRTVIDARGLDRVFELHGAVRLSLYGVTLTGGAAGPAPGGAVLAADVGSALSIDRSTLRGNRAGGRGGAVLSGGSFSLRRSAVVDNTAGDDGGGLAVAGSAEVVNSTLSGNLSEHRTGGGIYLAVGADLDLSQSTLYANSAMTIGGGLRIPEGATARVGGAILARNLTWSGGPDCYGTVASGGYNLVGLGHHCLGIADGLAGDRVGVSEPLDPRLGPLAMNGGPTPSHLPLAGSPALDCGPVGEMACAETDQRGERRPLASALPAPGQLLCDAGAVEAGALCVPGPDALCLGGGRFRVSARWQAPGAAVAEPARAKPLTDDTGFFWFFREGNVELVVKVLDACAGFGRHWVFASGLTHVGVELVVEDLVGGEAKTYIDEPGGAFRPIQDTDAFAGCP